MVYETVAGRIKEDLKKYGTKAAGYIGKHIVGTGEDAHLTTKVYIDLLRPHVILICGKRGSGKSYSAGTIIEEILSMEKEYAQKIACVIFDPVGIYWSMKFTNDQELDSLRQWNLEPKKFDQLKVYVPLELKDLYEKAGIPVDYTVSISPKDFSSDDWVLAFNLNRTSQEAITLGRNFNELSEDGKDFGIDEFIEKIMDDRIASQEIKNVLMNFLEAAKGWGIFSKGGMGIYDIIKPGQVSVIDFSRVKGEAWALRNLVAAWITRETYRERVLARKEEELAKVENRKPEKVFPLTWIVAEEAHNFCPSDISTVSTEPLLTIAKQGREPGISMVIITQMPNKVHQDILSQCDLVISFRLTSRDDLQALHAIMQTYVQEDLWKYINRLPRNMMGSAVLLDDNLEKIFTVNIRPRMSWHAGGTAAIT
jgi:DNA helicase HerA-like ATPase